jgi:small ligand-binding sensory domain FIST
MRWASAISSAATPVESVQQCARDVDRALHGERPDLVLCFVSLPHADGYAEAVGAIEASLRPRHSVGCSAGGVIGAGREIEQRPGLSLCAAVLAAVDVVPFHVDPAALPAADARQEAWEKALAVGASRNPHFIVLADPFTTDTDALLRGMDTAFPAGGKIGGLASGGAEPGTTTLHVAGHRHSSGAVGVALSGDVEVDTLVAQGCRPVGLPMFVTRCSGTVIHELDGRSPYDVLGELFRSLEPADQRLLRHSLFLGIVMHQAQEEYRQGDFLVRNIVGLDRDTRSMVVGGSVQHGQVVQFHLRDGRTSHEDLQAILARYSGEVDKATLRGGLLFSCLGRGEALYGVSNHDSTMVQRFLGDVPFAGFFCNGEIGPVHGKTFLHGYTSAIGLFRSPSS